MAWGTNGGIKSCDSLLSRIAENDPTLIEFVVLPMKNFGDDEVQRLADILACGSNTNLGTLSASGHKVSPDALNALGSAIATGQSNLTSLSIGDMSMGDPGVCALCEGFKGSGKLKLQSIDLSFKSIGTEGMISILENIGKCKSLQSLNLSRNEMIGTFLPSLPGGPFFPSLCYLDMSECGLDNSSCSVLSQSLNCPGVRIRINLNPKIEADGIASLMTLEPSEVHASRCSVGDLGLQNICLASCRIGNKIRHLDLSYCNLTPEGIQTFVDYLGGEPSFMNEMEELNFAGNALNEKSCRLLAAAIGNLKSKCNIPLASLDMTNTSCGVQGATEMISLAGLMKLTLFNNQLGSNGFEKLGVQLKGGHRTLEELDLGGNDASEEEVVELLRNLTSVEPLTDNKLKVLVVGGNETGAGVESTITNIEKSFPSLDIARDKPKKSKSNC